MEIAQSLQKNAVENWVIEQSSGIFRVVSLEYQTQSSKLLRWYNAGKMYR